MMVEMVSNRSILLYVTSEASLTKSFSDEPHYRFTTDQDGSPDDLWTDLSTAALLCARHGTGRIDESCTRRAFVSAESDPTKQGLSKPKRLSAYDMPADRHRRSEVQAVAMSLRSVSLTALNTKD
jgi:hypothetical protein